MRIFMCFLLCAVIGCSCGFDQDHRAGAAEKPEYKKMHSPKNLMESFSILKKTLSKKDIETFKKAKSVIIFHGTLGRWIRSNFGLWNKSKLYLYILEQGGDDLPLWKRIYTHPDSQSRLIMECFQQHLRNPQLTEEQLLAERRKYVIEVRRKMDSMREKEN